jgi:hypothetical protein
MSRAQTVNSLITENRANAVCNKRIDDGFNLLQEKHIIPLLSSV